MRQGPHKMYAHGESLSLFLLLSWEHEKKGTSLYERQVYALRRLIRLNYPPPAKLHTRQATQHATLE